MPFTVSSSDDKENLQSYILSRPDFRRDHLSSLYASLTWLEKFNIEGYKLNVLVWTLALTAATEKGLIPGSSDRLVLQTSPELVSALADNQFGTPAGLGKVVDEASHSGEWVPLKDFLSSQRSSVVWGILGWGYGKVFGRRSVNEEIVPVGSFVLVKAVDALARKVQAEYSARPRKIDRIFTLEMFRHDLRNTLHTELSETDTLVLATHLSRALNCSFDPAQSLIKFPARTSNAEAISQEDVSLLLLKTNLDRIEALITHMTERHNDQHERARAYLSRHPPNKTLALAALRSAKIMEKALKTQTEQRATLEDVLQNIEMAHSNLEMVNIMEKSEKLLKKLNKDIGGVEHVDEVMERVREGMRDTEEINAIITETGATLDEAELEDELVELELQEKERLEKDKDAAELRKLERLSKVTKTPQEEKDVESLTSSLGQMSVDGEEATGKAIVDEEKPAPAPLPA